MLVASDPFSVDVELATVESRVAVEGVESEGCIGIEVSVLV